MSTDLWTITDDNSGAFTYSGSRGTSPNPWILSTLVQWYNSSSWYPSSATETGTFTFTFEGTSVAFIGNTPSRPSPQNATVQIDNGTSFVINYQDPSPPSYKQWFQSPTLSNAQHTIKVSDLSGAAVDYAIVKVGNQTSLSGKTIIVDDDDSSIQYSGQWSRTTNEFVPGSLPLGHPYGNATHRSSNPGDSFTFQFTGTSVSIYGIFSWNVVGTLSATYTIDQTTTTQSYPVTTSSQSYQKRDGEASNFLYFSTENLSAGDHTLFVSITEAKNITYMFDYITYAPSFTSLSSMPRLAPSNITTTSASHSSPTSGDARSSTSEEDTHTTSTMIGGVIGGVAVGVLLTILAVWFIMRRRRRKAQQEAYALVEASTDQNHSDNNSHTSNNPSDSTQTQPRLSPLRPQRRQPATGTITPFQLSDSQPKYGPADMIKHQESNSSLALRPATSNPSLSMYSHSVALSSGPEANEPPSYDTISTRQPPSSRPS